MEIIEFIWESLWDILLILFGLLLVIVALKILGEEKEIRKTGIKTEAKVVDFSYEKIFEDDMSNSKIPIFEFYDNLGNKIIVKGKTNSICKIGQTTVIYYNPENPHHDYYLIQKDFLLKYILLVFGMFFLILGFIYFSKDFTEFNAK